MKYLVASDIHGSAYYCRKLIAAFEMEKADRMLILGDILYHGPRNDLPKEYAPKEVIGLLDAMKDKILAVRGNCDGEVDQMVLNFPIMADYAVLEHKGRLIYMTHGHIYNAENLPPLLEGDILLHGHTHVLKAECEKGFLILNPGSVSIPKNGNPPSYAVLEDGSFIIKDFDGNVLKSSYLQ